MIKTFGMKAIASLGLVIAVGLLLAGCQQNKDKTEPHAGETGDLSGKLATDWQSDGWVIPASWRGVTSSNQVELWAQEFEAAFQERNKIVATEMLDFAPMVDRTVKGVGSKGFNQGLKRGFSQTGKNFVQKLIDNSETYRFVRVTKNGFGEPAALFRMLSPDGEANYHIWSLHRNGAGELVAMDVYVFLSGERLSQSMRRMALLSAPKDERSLFEKLAGKEKEMVKNVRYVQDFLAAVQSQDFERANKVFETFPESLKREKSFVLINVIAAGKVGNVDKYIDLLKEYRQIFPSDSTGDLICLDLFYREGDFENLFSALSRLESQIGKDAYLMVLRANGLAKQGKYSEAMDYFDNAIEQESDLELTYWSAMSVMVDEDDFDGMLKMFKLLSMRFGYVEFDFEFDPMYKAFSESNQNKELIEFLAAIENAIE